MAAYNTLTSPITECVILAGGLGTRLRSVVADVPKCMAPVHNKPFLAYIIAYLESYGIERFIFSLGYRHEVITQYLTMHFPRLNAELVVEEEPLGTGGAIKLCCEKTAGNNVIVANGDTLFKADIHVLAKIHLQHRADCTLTLKPMHNFDRYGVVELKEDDTVKSFKEKQFYKEGLINGGLYALNVQSFLNEDLPQKFSFEKDYLEALYHKRTMIGILQDAYFIDIGIPEDYERAQRELSI
ncbi:nucleotidyltransferase [Ilyomonas limi]|uniref:Nucleotidyltransferase n=1 Tax=Ilyomonas limi TaxID=2575867 RepID=A0A4U3L123_9BACT|nr:nucleotidyltransferase family protein [Ilyomonas limi]TKK68668.1 nucleotidyltransferase [Ilyomonas limi]